VAADGAVIRSNRARNSPLRSAILV
jgi:hypothetical protein